jgi:solute carrier family 35, member F5
VGVFNILLLWPGFLLLHYTGLEPFELPSARVALELVLNGVLGTFLSDYLWLLALLMTSPVVVTLGLSLTIPLAVLADWLLGSALPAMAMYWSGAGLIVAAFVVVNLGAATTAADAAAARAAAAVRAACQRGRTGPGPPVLL